MDYQDSQVDQSDLKKTPVVVVIVPFLAQGHLNQLLHFSCLMSTYGLPVHYVGTATHNLQAKHRVEGWDPLAISNIHFHDFSISPFPIPPPDPNATMKFPSHLIPTFEATLHIHEPLSALLATLSVTARRLIIVHDTLMPFAAKEAASLPNAEAYALHCTSAFATLFYTWESLGKPTGVVIPNDLPYSSLEDSVPEKFWEFVGRQNHWNMFDVGNLYNTCRPIEGKFIDLLGQDQLKGNKRQWAIGPLNPVVCSSKDSQRRHKCLEWLDKQPQHSVLYVSFGTMTSISDDQIFELAIGLERSNQRFIWVLREADRGDIYAKEEIRKLQLPKGFAERLERIGFLVRDWAPQLEILAHPSTGGFMTHCGWNSCMESLSMGVPIAAWPMHSDQPRNTTLTTEVLKVGVVVRDWAERDELVSSATIEDAIKRLMASSEGDNMKRRAAELGGAVRQSVEDCGSSRTDLESFISHVSR